MIFYKNCAYLESIPSKIISHANVIIDFQYQAADISITPSDLNHFP